jgi:glycosyltransferase involved in cell wall biosynthesis
VNGKAGLLARYGDTEHFIEQSHRLLADPDLARSCRTAARRTAEKLDWTRVVKRMEAALFAAVEAPPALHGTTRRPVRARQQRRSARA